MRMAICIEYDGTNFYGWQYQDDKLRTVQAVVESALSKVADTQVKVVCAGRTDKGVHALNQIAHFDTEVKRSDKAWICGTNSYLPDDVIIKSVKHVKEDFHARFSAKFRHYRYLLLDNPFRSAISRNRVSWFCNKLNEKAMYIASQHLLGEHDFSSFRSANCQSKSPFRFISKIQLIRNHSNIVIDIIGNSFLYHMVRNIVGVLIPIGDGSKPESWIDEVLKAKDRRVGGITASPNGLYLVKVYYTSTTTEF